MEDIINKNIFEDRDLIKLSPDYCPSNIQLRMKIRQTMVKDTHNHEVLKNSNIQRKSINKVRDAHKINKEIVKIRNSFEHINLKNEVMLKNAKNIGAYKPKQIMNMITENLDEWDSTPHSFNCEFCNEDLILENDGEFRIKENPKTAKPVKEAIKKETNKANDCKSSEIEERIGIRIVQIYKSPREQEIDIYDEEKVKEILPEVTNVSNITLNPIQNGYVNDVSELQKLLVMMALTTKSIEEKTNETEIPVSQRTSIESERNDKSTTNSTDNPASILATTDITNILNIKGLREEISQKEKELLNKYANKWKQFVCRKIKIREEKRLETLNNFFNKLERKKKGNKLVGNEKIKSTVRDYNNYQHRYKVQKHIIALQKAKLEEQNRLIEELKYNKIIKASKQSVDEMKEEVRKTYYEIDRQLKPKIKCLSNELKMHEIEEPALILHCLKVPQFIQRMEKRARDREEKHAIIRERRRQMEEERIRLKEQAELAKAEMDREEKIKRMKELREKRKREKIENIRKKQHAEKLRALIVIADLHYEKSLMTKYAIRPFKRLIEIRRDNIEKAKAHYKFQLMKNVFLNWMWHTEDMWFERNYKAEDHWRKTLLKKTLKALKQNHHDYVLKRQVAEDYYDLYVTQLAFRKLREAHQILKREQEIKWNVAEAYFNSNLLFKSFTCWRTLPAINAIRREQEARKAKWREKALQVVPDYTPPDD